MKHSKNAGAKPGQAALNLGLTSASVSNSVVHMGGPPVIYEGWVLKKRRKKMQGNEFVQLVSQTSMLNMSLPSQALPGATSLFSNLDF